MLPGRLFLATLGATSPALLGRDICVQDQSEACLTGGVAHRRYGLARSDRDVPEQEEYTAEDGSGAHKKRTPPRQITALCGSISL